MLRRLQVARYPFERMVTLDQLQTLQANASASGEDLTLQLDPLLLPMDSPAADFPAVNLSSDAAAYFKQGQPVHASQAPNQGLVRVTEGEEGKFIGMAEVADDGRIAPRRLVVEYQD